jgi:hypothetical protein
MFYKPGIMLKYLSTDSTYYHNSFNIYFKSVGIKTPEKFAGENISAEGQHDRRISICSSIKNEFLMLLEALSFSMTVFLSGTKIFRYVQYPRYSR